MPELPEVETTKRGIVPYLVGYTIVQVILRHHQLRWPIPAHLPKTLAKQGIHDVTRRGKYLIFSLPQGYLLWHLGMSGSLRILPLGTTVQKHDHVDLQLNNGCLLRFTDPRRFGALLWTTASPEDHPLLASLGPEPLTRSFTANYLYQQAQRRRLAIKQLIMDSHCVVGVGNIYANEALFLAGIHPAYPSNFITPLQGACLVQAIKTILRNAIQQGGTTLRDFTNSDGKPGYFKQQLAVYGRQNQLCQHCGVAIQSIRQQQRSSYFCPSCQPLKRIATS